MYIYFLYTQNLWVSLCAALAELSCACSAGGLQSSRRRSAVQGRHAQIHGSSTGQLCPATFCRALLFLSWMQVSNADTSLLFFSHKQEEVFQWAQAIEDVIRYRPMAGNCTCIHICCLVSTFIRSFTTDSKIAACRIVSFLFLHCRNLQLAFGSLLNTNKAPVHTGDTVENPLLKLGNLDKPPVSWVKEILWRTLTQFIVMNLYYSLVPRPSPSFPSLAVRLSILRAMGRWARAWEQGYLYCSCI